jgi:hypothetical protein
MRDREKLAREQHELDRFGKISKLKHGNSSAVKLTDARTRRR